MKRKQEAGGRKRVMPAVLAVALLAVACGRPAARSEASATARASGTPTPASGRKVLYWYDPMAPGSKFDKPGKSPFMDMQLVPKYADEEGGSPAAGSAAAVTLSPEAIRASGIATVAATRESLSGAIRAVGTIEIDETKQVRVSARVAGRIEKLYAGFTGQAVQAGAPLYEIYSPELVATEREYLLSLENRRALSGATPDTVRAADELVTASRDRLRLWGIGPEQIAALERTRKPELALTYRCPITGTVMQKTAVEGQYVTEGTELYLLADLSTVWLMAQVYEYELGRLRIGQTAEVSVSAIPGRILRGRIAFIEPVLDRETRSARVRIALPNPGGILKPGMFADARLETPGRRFARRPEERPDRHGRPPAGLRRGLSQHVRRARRQDRGGLRRSRRGRRGARRRRPRRRGGRVLRGLAGAALGWRGGAVQRRARREGEAQGGQAVINRIIDFSLDNRFLVLGLTLLLAAAGIHAARTNPVDAIPDISETQVIVFADWPGRSPQEVEDQVTYPLAVNLHGLAGVKAVRSSSALRLLDDQRDLRGRHGPLLRADAHPRAAEPRRGAPAQGA